MLKSKKYGKELTEDVLIQDYFSKASDANQWTAAIFFLYEASLNYDKLKMQEIMKTFLVWFKEFFFNWTSETHYFVDAMALRIIWDVYGFNIFNVVDEKEKQLVRYDRESKKKIEEYAKNIKYSILRSFMMMKEDTEKTLEEETTAWLENIGKNWFDDNH
jgi:hypothetical protein